LLFAVFHQGYKTSIGDFYATVQLRDHQGHLYLPIDLNECTQARQNKILGTGVRERDVQANGVIY